MDEGDDGETEFVWRWRWIDGGWYDQRTEMVVEEKEWIESSFATIFFSWTHFSASLSLTQSRFPLKEDDVHMFLFLVAGCGEGEMMNMPYFFL